MATLIAVEMGETRVSSTLTDCLQVCGLGACVGLCLYDPVTRLAALAHIVMPQTLPPSPGRAALPTPPGKCADTAIPAALEELARHGARRESLQSAIVGGAQIFAYASFTKPSSQTDGAKPSRLEIGPRNVIAVRQALMAHGIPLIAEEVGGHCGRSVSLLVNNGDISLHEIGTEEHFWVSLGQSSQSHSLRQEGMCAHG